MQWVLNYISPVYYMTHNKFNSLMYTYVQIQK